MSGGQMYTHERQYSKKVNAKINKFTPTKKKITADRNEVRKLFLRDMEFFSTHCVALFVIHGRKILVNQHIKHTNNHKSSSLRWIWLRGWKKISSINLAWMFVVWINRSFDICRESTLRVIWNYAMEEKVKDDEIKIMMI